MQTKLLAAGVQIAAGPPKLFKKALAKKRSDMTTKVHFDSYGCFTSIIASTIEPYPKEGFGFLGGKTSHKIRYHKSSKDIIIQAAYPLQTAKRKEDKVEFKDLKSFKRTRNLLNCLGFDIIGEYHSHPKENLLKITKDDIDHDIEEIKELKKENLAISFKWMDLIIGINRKRYKTNFGEQSEWIKDKNKIKGTVRDRKFGYKFEITGYLFDINNPKKYDEANLFLPSK